MPQNSNGNIDQLAHIWNHCHGCNAGPIIGTRYECQSCPIGPDNDLCSNCYEQYLQGNITHPNVNTLITSDTITNHHFKVYQGKSVSQYEAGLQYKQPATPAPKIPNGLIVRPEFCAGLHSTFAAYAFVVATAENSFAITALHVMDEMIKYKAIDAGPDNSNYTGNELPKVITHVNLYDLFADNWMTSWLGKADSMLVLPNARIHDEEPDSNRDIAVFHIGENTGLRPGKLAMKPPAVGEAVWLAASMGENNYCRTRAAVVVEVTDKSFVFMYEDCDEGPSYTSGAPIVNSVGEVVAINVGGGRLQNRKLGHGNHVGNIYKHLNDAGIHS